MKFIVGVLYCDTHVHVMSLSSMSLLWFYLLLLITVCLVEVNKCSSEAPKLSFWGVSRVVCKAIFMSNPTKVKLKLSWDFGTYGDGE